MDSIKRKTLEGWIDKARNNLASATEKHKTFYQDSECVQDAQECVELSVKSLLALLEIDFPPAHGWTKERLEKIAQQIRDRQILERLEKAGILDSVRLPRLLFLANFWSQFYVQAKYGMEAGYLASAKDLIGSVEADVAVKHAQECFSAVCVAWCLDEERLAALVI